MQIKYVLPKLCHLPQYSYRSRDPTIRVLGYASYPGLGTRDPYSYWGWWQVWQPILNLYNNGNNFRGQMFKKEILVIWTSNLFCYYTRVARIDFFFKKTKRNETLRSASGHHRRTNKQTTEFMEFICLFAPVTSLWLYEYFIQSYSHNQIGKMNQ